MNRSPIPFWPFPRPWCVMIPSLHLPAVRLGVPLLLCGLVMTACGGEGGPKESPDLRPPDGLLSDPTLQEVVARQRERDTGGLTVFLEDPRAAVRARAALALASVQDPNSIGALVAALEDPEPSVRRDAAFALGQVGDPSVVTPLVAAFPREADPEVRRRILEALSKPRSTEAAQGLMGLRVSEGEELERIAALARLAGARGVATFAGQDHLLDHLEDGDPEIRRWSAYYFGRVSDPSAWAPHAQRLRAILDGYALDEPAGAYLIQGLARLGDPQDGARFRRWVASAEDWRARVNAAAALGALPPEPDNRDALFGALDDEMAQVAVTAAESLARGTPIPSELQRMKAWIEAHPELWQGAGPLLISLARGDEREFVFGWMDGLPADDPYRWSVAFQALASMPGNEAIDRLAAGLGADDARIRGGAVSALVQRWEQDKAFRGMPERYFDLFRGVLGSGSLQAAFSAAQALGDPALAALGSGRVLTEAYAGMEAPRDLEPMMAILESLGRMGDPSGIPVLEAGARSPYRALRQAAVTGLERFGRAVPADTAEAPDPAQGAGAATDTPQLDWAYLAALGERPALVLETTRGTFRVRLHTEGAPLTVQTVARLAEEGRYDGVPFHRVVPNFVVQGGDFSSGDGFGGPGFTITSEFNLLPFAEGVAGMASAGKDTEGSQFFITHSMQPHLDGGYTTFGWVESGMDVVERLLVGDAVLRATVERGR